MCNKISYETKKIAQKEAKIIMNQKKTGYIPTIVGIVEAGI